ncbi:hypothetical protein PR002_g31996 [Phytophthora rubi]|uniref:Uncharacterized protein n=1 Tax=Phytophthora rubi TaxID=129364 RepID=A0A6A3GDA7_9STRA|nr:hypothetical protein PR002_g31996 [Phytophthora rubi]
MSKPSAFQRAFDTTLQDISSDLLPAATPLLSISSLMQRAELDSEEATIELDSGEGGGRAGLGGGHGRAGPRGVKGRAGLGGGHGLAGLGGGHGLAGPGGGGGPSWTRRRQGSIRTWWAPRSS